MSKPSALGAAPDLDTPHTPRAQRRTGPNRVVGGVDLDDLLARTAELMARMSKLQAQYEETQRLFREMKQRPQGPAAASPSPAPERARR